MVLKVKSGIQKTAGWQAFHQSSWLASISPEVMFVFFISLTSISQFQSKETLQNRRYAAQNGYNVQNSQWWWPILHK